MLQPSPKPPRSTEPSGDSQNQDPQKRVVPRSFKITAGVAGASLALLGTGLAIKKVFFDGSGQTNDGLYKTLDDAAISGNLPGGVKDPNAPLGDSYTSVDALTSALTEQTNAEDAAACATDLFLYPQLLYYGPDMAEGGTDDSTDLKYVADSHRSANAKVRTVTFQTDTDGDVLANLTTDTQGITFNGVDIGGPLATPDGSFLGRDCRGIRQPGGGIGTKYGSNNSSSGTEGGGTTETVAPSELSGDHGNGETYSEQGNEDSITDMEWTNIQKNLTNEDIQAIIDAGLALQGSDLRADATEFMRFQQNVDAVWGQKGNIVTYTFIYNGETVFWTTLDLTQLGQ